MDMSKLDPKMRERIEACQSPEEIFALAKEENVELTDEELEAVSGGAGWEPVKAFVYCDRCKNNVEVTDAERKAGFKVCPHCGKRIKLG